MSEQPVQAVIQWIILGIATERATELIVDSKISEVIFRKRLREAAHPILPDGPMPLTWRRQLLILLDDLLSCGYCTSVWVGALFALFAPDVVSISDPGSGCLSELYDRVVNWLIVSLLLHGQANIYHVLFMLIKKGRVRSHDLLVQISMPREVDDGRRKVGDGPGEGETTPL